MTLWVEPPSDWSAVDYRLGLPSNAQVERLAELIDAAHTRHRQPDETARWRNPVHRQMGLYGERHIARLLNLRMDLSIKPYGNQRRNLVLANGTVLDVVTRSMLKNGSYPDLPRKVGSRGRVDALVLVVWHGTTYEPEVPGWVPEPEMIERGALQRWKDGIENIVVPVGLLDPFWTLAELHNPDSYFACPESDIYLTICRTPEEEDEEEEEPDDEPEEPSGPRQYQPPLF